MRVTLQRQTQLSAVFLVEADNAVYVIEYDAAGLGELVYVNGFRT
jgi:hypothetical protein